jgi:SAM-dependent methyltransferase
MSDQTAVSWSELTSWRNEGYKRFGGILDLPIVRFEPEIKRLLGQATRVLDVGAGRDLPLKAKVDPDTEYRSLDADPIGDFDYATVADIPDGERFDLAVSNQVLEHVTVPEAIEIVQGVAGVLEPGGRFAATVPNVSHPVRHWADATHVTAWGLWDLYGLFRMAGLEVESLARYGKQQLTWRPFRRLIVKAVAREYRVDWCDSILIVATRPARAGS